MSVANRALALARALGSPFDLWFDRRRVQPAARRQRLLARRGVDCVIDVGAHRGEFASELRRFGYTGEIHSFEPLPSAAAHLRRRSARDPRWHVHELALADRPGEVTLYVAENEVSSSLRPIAAQHIAAAPESATSHRLSVAAARLDDVAGPADRTVCLKLDVQGAEDLVLVGAQRTLTRTEVVQLELSVVPLYDGQQLYIEQIGLLDDLGFDLAGVAQGFSDPTEATMLQFDGLFARRHPHLP